jgi:hypothetical protein
MSQEFHGEERQIKRVSGAAIDGAPITYVIAFAAVVAALAAVPLSIVIGTGKSFPLSQAIYPLAGWVLGPVAGAVADGVGALVGTWLFPQTTTVPVATIFGATMAGLAAGVMRAPRERRGWWVPLGALFLLVFLVYVGRAILVNGVRWWAALAGSTIDWTALLLFLLPTRTLCGRWIAGEGAKRSVGLFLGTWIAAGLAHLCAAVIVDFVYNSPEVVWLTIAPLAPLEHTLRALVGTVVGTGVIAGLRATGLVKPEHAVY